MPPAPLSAAVAGKLAPLPAALSLHLNASQAANKNHLMVTGFLLRSILCTVDALQGLLKSANCGFVPMCSFTSVCHISSGPILFRFKVYRVGVNSRGLLLE
jgi:hypothetical protein